MELNNWTDAEVKRAERLWGHTVHPYSAEMFDFAIKGVKSWLDLGCGFGRFLEYLDERVVEADYIGYDSSEDMVARIKQRFFEYASRVFVHNITDPIVNPQESIICSAVLIHITLEDQDKVLNNIKDKNPIKASFDINSPSEEWLAKPNAVHFEKQIKCSEGLFRMTWQSHYVFTEKVKALFPNYKVKTDFFPLHARRTKVIYMLERSTEGV